MCLYGQISMAFQIGHQTVFSFNCWYFLCRVTEVLAVMLPSAPLYVWLSVLTPVTGCLDLMLHNYGWGSGRDEQNLGKSKWYFVHNFQQTELNKCHHFNSSLPSHIFKWNLGENNIEYKQTFCLFNFILSGIPDCMCYKLLTFTYLKQQIFSRMFMYFSRILYWNLSASLCVTWLKVEFRILYNVKQTFNKLKISKIAPKFTF